MAVSDSVREAWLQNIRINDNLLAQLTQDMMSARSPGGGMTVAEHLAHTTGTTNYWASLLNDDGLRRTPRLFDLEGEGDDMEFIAYTDLELFRERMGETRRAVLEAAEAAPAGETGEAPHTSADALLIHMMAHDSHHRGQLLLALKTEGFDLPSEESLWLPWRNEPWP